jgi:hypothetical protein
MTRTLVDHESIKEWADAHDARPARVQGTGGAQDPGILRLATPIEHEDGLDRISWDEWLRKFDASGLALLVEDDESEQHSTYNRFVKRPEPEAPSRGRSIRVVRKTSDTH